jgi:hypothetical protein
MTKIALLAGNELEAYQFARSQNFERNQYFIIHNKGDLLFRQNFHVIVCGTAGMNSPSSVFNEIYNLALERGRIGRN